MTVSPNLEAYCTAKCPRPPIPMTAQVMFGFECLLMGANTVSPAQSNGEPLASSNPGIIYTEYQLVMGIPSSNLIECVFSILPSNPQHRVHRICCIDYYFQPCNVHSSGTLISMDCILLYLLPWMWSPTCQPAPPSQQSHVLGNQGRDYSVIDYNLHGGIPKSSCVETITVAESSVCNLNSDFGVW